jgi:hypothetical protein
MLASNNIFDGRNSLCTGGMGQHHLPVSISDAVDIGHKLATIGLGQNLHVFIDRHETTLGFNPHGLQSHVLCVWDTSGSNHAGIHLQGFNVFSVV